MAEEEKKNKEEKKNAFLHICQTHKAPSTCRESKSLYLCPVIVNFVNDSAPDTGTTVLVHADCPIATREIACLRIKSNNSSTWSHCRHHIHPFPARRACNWRHCWRRGAGLAEFAVAALRSFVILHMHDWFGENRKNHSFFGHRPRSAKGLIDKLSWNYLSVMTQRCQIQFWVASRT